MSATCTCGWSRWNSPSTTGKTLPPGPVEAPISRRPVSSPSASSPISWRSLLLEREQPLRAAVEPHPGLGRLDPAPGAVEQLLPEPLLERPDLQAHRRLRDAELLSRLGEAPALDDSAECRELLRVHNDNL